MNHQIILIDPDENRATILAKRLRAQGYLAIIANDPIQGATLALAEPPAAVIADLWMPNVSGVQLCRLLRSEASTIDVPVILRGPSAAPREQFWSERAGAQAYIPKGRMGELVRALERVIEPNCEDDIFFTHLDHSTSSIQERIATLLDEALFDSVVAAEVRALGACGSFERLFDLFSQLATRLGAYRWLAIQTFAPSRLALHTNPACREDAYAEACEALSVPASKALVLIEDEDAQDLPGQRLLQQDIVFAGTPIGTIAIAGLDAQEESPCLATLFARELGAPLRMVSLVEESHRMATTDLLTGLSNRRHFLSEFQGFGSPGEPCSLLLLDIDHFKVVNDTHGHAAGDLVLSIVGQTMIDSASASVLPARWGGEEFIVALRGLGLEAALEYAEGLRAKIESLEIEGIPVTVSIGAATTRPADSIDELIDRADRAMYVAKSSGRNRVCSQEDVQGLLSKPAVAPSPTTHAEPRRAP